MKSARIALIGMPCAGKSTVGEILARKLGYDFFDLDKMVEEQEGMSLIEVMNLKGATYFRNMEYSFIEKLDPDKHAVISPAGSIIFQTQAMEWLVNNSSIFFLDVPFETIEARLKEAPKAVQGLKERGLMSIWNERMPIYTKYANSVIQTAGLSADDIANEILRQYKA